jgi:hypothetical protein
MVCSLCVFLFFFSYFLLFTSILIFPPNVIPLSTQYLTSALVTLQRTNERTHHAAPCFHFVFIDFSFRSCSFWRTLFFFSGSLFCSPSFFIYSFFLICTPYRVLRTPYFHFPSASPPSTPSGLHSGYGPSAQHNHKRWVISIVSRLRVFPRPSESRVHILFAPFFELPFLFIL